MRRSSGGTFGAWHLTALNKYLAGTTAGDAVVQEATGKVLSYVCTDKHRPGTIFKGRTPAQAARNAGFWVPKGNFAI